MSTTRIELAAGELVFREGDAPTSAYLIEAGRIEVVTAQGEEVVVLGRLGPGDLLGEMAVIDQSPRTATARAMTECTLTVLGREQLNERLENADPIVRALLRGQLQRYRAALATLRGDGEAMRAEDSSEREADVDAGAIGKIRLENQLREAIAQRSLEVRYQPIFEIVGGRVRGYEALIRWEHPERGPVSPAEFIALAEETSLIVPVGNYVFECVSEMLARFVQAGHSPLPWVAVNVSARQLASEGLLEHLVSVARRDKVPAQAFKIEITEGLALDVQRVAALIERCHELGLQVALDDFGTGYSNLGHLHRLRFDTVKLDQGFTRQMVGDPRSRAIVQAIVTMVSALGADLIAEGVETPEQLELLRAMGCRYAQGYLIGRPQAGDEALASWGA
ncbi:MAG TPA: EAL domain-containing protein [Xanthomonadales bacterium]|nr:EAL domain-containing protein [Xanthomonadales bacterium]